MINKDIKHLYKVAINFNMYFDTTEAMIAEHEIRERGRIPVAIINDNNIILFELNKQM